MLWFMNDYSEGAHGAILQRLLDTNYESTSGYGTDEYCASAEKKIKAACKADNAQVFFISGGTQTNQLTIDAVLKRYEAVLSAQTGHVAAHEAGAIEFTGHKVIGIPQHDGKIDIPAAEEYMATFYADANHDHMPFPGMVYISHPTEYGTLYTLDELTRLRALCDKYAMSLFVDGARLGYALATPENELSLPELARLTDVFYIGGTKVGALFGEALVFTHGNAPEHFITSVKQHGAMLAKGRILGLQFDTLFTDGLYEKIAANAIVCARRLRAALIEKGYRIYVDSPTNQLFIVMENSKLEKLGEKVRYGFWEKLDNEHTVIRFATSWATSEKSVDELIELL